MSKCEHFDLRESQPISLKTHVGRVVDGISEMSRASILAIVEAYMRDREHKQKL